MVADRAGPPQVEKATRSRFRHRCRCYRQQLLASLRLRSYLQVHSLDGRCQVDAAAPSALVDELVAGEMV